ncbi:uromodulin-like [Phyllobates terribilis]|uniref:uromodulin-like n=1 Tax=Phyllobates terribilis TaxID=111132 RepID=UPI003CCA7BB9
MCPDSEVSTTTTSPPNCKDREGTSFTLLVDNFPPWFYQYPVEHLVNRLCEKFPCVQRQYTLVKVNNSDISESIAETKDEFIRNLKDYNLWEYYYSFHNIYNGFDSYNPDMCNQSILHGLKRALEISPAESFILTLSSGSIIDYNNTEIIAEIYTLIKEKKSQVFFINYNYCASELQEDVLHDIATLSYGYYTKTYIYSIYQTLYGLDLFLMKPLNTSTLILNLDFTSFSRHVQEFNVTSSLTFIMISTNGNGIFNFTDPVGNTPTFERKLSHLSGNTYLVKSPTPGTWLLDMVCYDFCSVRIWSFTGLESGGNCSVSACNRYASCEEFGGYQECTCSSGFQGDGINCRDINECDDYFLNYCPISCNNTVGSFFCSCPPATEYKEKEGCVDIDECVANPCHPFATCANYYNSYTCTCLGGYYGDGMNCELECQKGTTHDSDTYYNVSLEPIGCMDPCYNHSIVDEQWRFVKNSDLYAWYRCDYYMYGWYRFQGKTEQRIPEHCIKEFSCGTQSPLWINDTHPKVEDGTVNATVCASWNGDCCAWRHPISIRACPGGYYVYKIQNTPICNAAYCTEPVISNPNCSSMCCATDEECLTLEGGSECHCKKSDHSVNALQTSTHANHLFPDLVCGPSKIKLSYSKCMLEAMGYDTSSVYLKDRKCTGFIGREDKSYIQIDMLPKKGYCGAELKINKTHFTYANSIYLSQILDGAIQRNQAIVNFSCSYPLNMDISLWTAINPFVSSVNLSIGGTGLYAAKMALYQDDAFSRPYEGPDVWLSTDSMMYVGVIVDEIQEFSFALVLKNCYATPTSDSGHPIKYYIIKDNCANRNDPSISVKQNGLSLHGQFSLQVFSFIGNLDQVYLHCQIKLCDTSAGSCVPKCFGMRSAAQDNEKDTTLTLGPIHQKVLTPVPPSLPAPVPQSSSTGIATSFTVLILTLCFNLMTYN